MPDLDKRLDEIEKKLNGISSAPYPVFGNQISSVDDEIDLLELWNAIWAGKWIIVGVTFLFAVAAVLYSLSLSNMYRAETVLSPASQSSSGSLSRLAGQFGGLASLAGINIGGPESTKEVIALEVMKSRPFIESFIEKYSIGAQVYAANGWDESSRELEYDRRLVNSSNGEWVIDRGTGLSVEPNSWELYKKFSKYLSVSRDKDTGLIRVSVEYYSPIVSTEWVTMLVKELNSVMRVGDVAESTKNIQFLERQIDKTAIQGMKSVFYQLIEEQTKTLMLASSSDDYVFKVVSMAMTPEEPSAPNRTLICVVSVLLGGFLSTIGVLALYFLGRESRP